MRFWKIEGTPYHSDYQRAFVNGRIEYPYSLPSVQCPTCHRAPGHDRMIPYRCPAAQRQRFTDPPEVTLEEFARLAARIRQAFQRRGLNPEWVQPGSPILPCHLDVPSKPEADFLWPGLSCMVVHERVRDALDSLQLREVTFGEATLRKVGRRSAKLAPPSPSTGEPEDMVHEVPTTRSSKGVPRYFELCVYGRSAPPPGREVRKVCPACGDPDFGWAPSRNLVMTESMWTGLDLFVLETTGYFLVTDRFKEAVEKLRATNVSFAPFPAIVEPASESSPARLKRRRKRQ